MIKRASLLVLATLFILCMVQLVHANVERNTFSIGESYRIDDKNITVIDIDNQRDKVVVCVNNVRDIVDEDGDTVNGVNLKVEKASDDRANVRISYSCNKYRCQCIDDSCSNAECTGEVERRYPPVKLNYTTPPKPTQNPQVVPPSTGKVTKEIKVVRQAQESNLFTSNVALIAVFIILIGIAVLFWIFF